MTRVLKHDSKRNAKNTLSPDLNAFEDQIDTPNAAALSSGDGYDLEACRRSPTLYFMFDVDVLTSKGAILSIAIMRRHL